jgi:hypothetical protein
MRKDGGVIFRLFDVRDRSRAYDQGGRLFNYKNCYVLLQDCTDHNLKGSRILYTLIDAQDPERYRRIKYLKEEFSSTTELVAVVYNTMTEVHLEIVKGELLDKSKDYSMKHVISEEFLAKDIKAVVSATALADMVQRTGTTLFIPNRDSYPSRSNISKIIPAVDKAPASPVNEVPASDVIFEDRIPFAAGSDDPSRAMDVTSGPDVGKAPASPVVSEALASPVVSEALASDVSLEDRIPFAPGSDDPSRAMDVTSGPDVGKAPASPVVSEALASDVSLEDRIPFAPGSDDPSRTMTSSLDADDVVSEAPSKKMGVLERFRAWLIKILS